jgi:acetyl esterase/lipase/enterochelin esterase-like enzyme
MLRVVRLLSLCLSLNWPSAAQQQPTDSPRPSPFFKVLRDIEYDRIGGKALRLDLYLPETPNEPRPVVLWIHGESGDKYPCPAARLVGDGYVVASMNYQSTSEAGFPAQIEDGKAAVRWLRANALKYALDAKLIGVWGESAGGFLASMLGTAGDAKNLEGKRINPEQSSRVQAVVDFYGPQPAGEAGPTFYASKDDPPFLIVHGSADKAVPAGRSQDFCTALKAAGIDANIELEPAAGHAFKEVYTPRIAEVTETFLDKHLRDGKRTRMTLERLSAPDDAWEDPITDEPAGTHYHLYPTPSRGTGTRASYLIYLPPDYETAKARRYPVIYYLHGLTGTSRDGAWLVEKADASIRAGKMPPVIVVSVNGLTRGWYVDSKDGKQMVESAIIKDLIPHIDSTYRTVARREGRAIEGMSMGGFGALRLGFKYPELFGTVSSIAAALHTLEEMKEEEHKFDAAFGDPSYLEAVAPWTIVEKNADSIRNRTLVRMLVGDRDPLTARSQTFHELLNRLKIGHSYDTAKGAGHNYRQILANLDFDPFEFWNKAFAKAR